MTDKVFDYLEQREKDTYKLCMEEKEKLDKHIRNYEWDEVINSVTRLKTYYAELNMLTSMVEAHECGDI